MRRFITNLLVGVLVLSAPLANSADTTAAPTTQADLDHALAQALAQEDTSRSRITSLLQRDEVRRLAEGHGLDIRRAEAAVGTLQGNELERLAQLAAQTEVQLAGGDTVIRISLVALLLIIIIVILLTR
jgi:uncharacterized protein YaiL (DUF2058 family)